MLLKNYGAKKKMMFGTKFKQGDILIVPFPFSELSSIKQRPVLVLSKNNDISDDIITCGITSYLKDAENSILISNESLNKGNIPQESRIKVDKIFSLEKTIIKKKIGEINKDTMKKVKAIFINLV